MNKPEGHNHLNEESIHDSFRLLFIQRVDFLGRKSFQTIKHFRADRFGIVFGYIALFNFQTTAAFQGQQNHNLHHPRFFASPNINLF